MESAYFAINTSTCTTSVHRCPNFSVYMYICMYVHANPCKSILFVRVVNVCLFFTLNKKVHYCNDVGHYILFKIFCSVIHKEINNCLSKVKK